MGHQEIDTPRPVLLAPTNFTPPARTPWGGRRVRRLKGLGGEDVVGESWELSVEPSFESRTTDGRTLAERIAASPREWLGAEAPRGGTALLVKLLDAGAPLSVQIHPADGWSGLGPGESGKPESWYVVERDEGAGLYLGLREGTDRAAIERALDEGADVSALLTFVPVEPGDFFVIEAGTPHCVGAGVFLVEPQHVAPGRRGVTYRYWDWNRRYAPDGREDPAGQPRELHRERALAVTDWDQPRGAALLAKVRYRAGPPALDAEASLEPLCGPGGRLESAHLRVSRLAGSGELTLGDGGVLRAVTVLAGRVTIDGVTVETGRTAAVPARAAGRARAERAHAVVSAPRP